MKLYYRLLCVIIATILIGNLDSLYSQDSRIFLNPGGKFGYTFGDDQGFSPGIEISAVYGHNEIGGYIGILLSTGISGNFKKTHFAMEGGFGPLGISFGPTWVSVNEYSYIGWTLTPYFGVILIPYYSITFIPGFQYYHEIGSFLKFPILIKGPKYNLSPG
jgi:hypothetical protein